MKEKLGSRKIRSVNAGDGKLSAFSPPDANSKAREDCPIS